MIRHWMWITENLEWPSSSRQGQGHMRRLRQKAAQEMRAQHPELLYDVWIQMNHPRHNFDLPENSRYVEAKWVSIQFHTCSSGGSKISSLGFSSGGSGIFLRWAPTPNANLLFFAENCMKLKEFGPPRVPDAPPPGSANGSYLNLIYRYLPAATKLWPR